MRRAAVIRALALGVVLVLSRPAAADVTLGAKTSITGGPMAMDSTTVMAVKGKKARVDMTIMGQERSIIIDLATRKVTMLDHAARTAQPMDVSGFQAMTDQLSGGFSLTKADLTSTGQKKDIGGVPCEEYRFAMSGRMSPMGQAIDITVAGTQWLAKTKAAEVAEILAFSAAAREAGLGSFLGLGGSGGLPIPQKDLAKLMEQQNGVAFAADMEMSMTGEGDAAAMLSQMGQMKVTMAVTSFSADPIPDERFAIPAGYAAK
jgi:hypothetical protein